LTASHLGKDNNRHEPELNRGYKYTGVKEYINKEQVNTMGKYWNK